MIALMALAAFAAHTAAEEAPESAQPTSRLVSFNELQKRLNEAKLRLLDVRPRADYDRSHIPGAVSADAKAAAALAAKPGA
jgi:thiosulfate/3-mercaptopyruvate sulfurtransferase